MPPHSQWTDERLAEASRLWQGGLSASEIAKRLGMGVTRNAVIAKLHRKGLTVRTVPSQAERGRLGLIVSTGGRVGATTRGGTEAVKQARARIANKAPPKPRNNGFAAINAGRRVERLARDAERNKLPEERIRDATFARPWTERVFGQCAFPISGEGADVVSCCAPTDGKTYCPACEAVVFAPAKQTAKRFEKFAVYLATRAA